MLRYQIEANHISGYEDEIHTIVWDTKKFPYKMVSENVLDAKQYWRLKALVDSANNVNNGNEGER